MYEKILEALKTKFKGVPGKVLEMRAKNLSKTVTEDDGVQTAVDGVTFEDLFEAYGDSKATKAVETASKNAVDKFKKDNSLDEKGNKITGGGNKGGDDDDPSKKGGNDGDAPSWAKSLIDRLEKIETGKKAEERTALITGKLNAAKIPEKLHKRFSVAEDADDSAIEIAIKEFKQDLNDLGISILKEPGGGGSSELSEDDYKKIMNGETSAEDAGTVKINA